MAVAASDMKVSQALVPSCVRVPKLDRPFANPFSCPQLGGVVMQRDLRVIEDDQHGGFFRFGLGGTIIQGIIAGHCGGKLVEQIVQPNVLCV